MGSNDQKNVFSHFILLISGAKILLGDYEDQISIET
jgi:hypothetical protein